MLQYRRMFSQWSLIAVSAWLCSQQAFAFSGAGLGTTSSPYQITSVDQLQEMNLNLSASYVLATDINASITSSWNGGSGFQPVGSESARFVGFFNGQGHTISNLYISISGGSYVGLFGYVGTAGKIRNVTLNAATVNSMDHVGTLVGWNDGQICNCYAFGTLSGGGSFGGLVGRNDGSVEHSAATVTVSDGNHLGGLVGNNHGTIVNCYAKGNVSGAEDPGGLVGVNYGKILNCYATGDVNSSSGYSAADYQRGAGGLIGLNMVYLLSNAPCVVSNCFATGDVSAPGSLPTGGLIGANGYAEHLSDGSPVVANCYYNHTAGNPAIGIGTNYCLVASTCTAINNNESYFFRNTNQPEKSWDFCRVWSFPGDLAGITYPEFETYWSDTSAPVIRSITANPRVIAVLNHKMIRTTLTVTATDDIDPRPSARITSVKVMDGDEENRLAERFDVNILNNLTLDLRASGPLRQRTYRVYVITVTCTDAAGNHSCQTVEIAVRPGSSLR